MIEKDACFYVGWILSEGEKFSLWCRKRTLTVICFLSWLQVNIMKSVLIENAQRVLMEEECFASRIHLSLRCLDHPRCAEWIDLSCRSCCAMSHGTMLLGSRSSIDKDFIYDSGKKSKVPKQPWYKTLCVLDPGVKRRHSSVSRQCNGIWPPFGRYLEERALHHPRLLFFCFLLLNAKISIILCYVHLWCKDCRWWWSLFLKAGSSALSFSSTPYTIFHAVGDHKGRAHCPLFCLYADCLSCPNRHGLGHWLLLTLLIH